MADIPAPKTPVISSPEVETTPSPLPLLMTASPSVFDAIVTEDKKEPEDKQGTEDKKDQDSTSGPDAKAKDTPGEDDTKTKDAADGDDTKSESGDNVDSDDWKKKHLEKLKAAWKFKDFEQYKNRYGPDDGLEIIEVLRGYQHIEHDFWKEREARYVKGKTGKSDSKWKRRPTPFLKDVGPEYPQRIRIQSPHLILILARLSGNHESWDTHKPRTFLRPFRTQYHYLPQMKEVLTALERKVGDATSPRDGRDGVAKGDEEVGDDIDDDASDTSSVSEGPEDADTEDLIRGIENTAEALQHVKTYVEFVQAYVVPFWDQARGTKKRRVTFFDLWASFIHGEILFRPPVTDAKKGKAVSQPVNKTHQSAWRLYSMVMPDRSEEDVILNGRSVTKDITFDLHCYYIDYDGRSYLPVSETFMIDYFDGEKDITQLPIYPLRFAKEKDTLMKTLREQGQKFYDYTTKRYLFYDGWTLTQSPTGRSEKDKELVSEHIDSTVIVDFLEGYKADSSLSPPSTEGLDEFDDSNWPEAQDEMEIRHWHSTARSANPGKDVLGVMSETTMKNEWFGEHLARRHYKNRVQSKFIRDWKSKKAGLTTELTGDDLALLPRRLVVFAFRERKFILANIDYLREVRKQEDVFGDLKIDPRHKQMIESLVETHFQKQSIQKKSGAVNLNQDLIRGKGSGLVMLLHGVPGVGKTATAEAIAQINAKPLFTITCGDLGFEPRSVDESLRNIFRLAHLWDCVLLLDEADVFLSRREVYDLKRNALVSVFLRVLEYYSGILFLTTNRVGHLDEAFKSRIHISLYYPPLSQEQTVAIFEVNIKQLSKIEDEKQDLMSRPESGIETRPKMVINERIIINYAKWHWKVHRPSERWNGRQIRNAFQIAYSLAQRPNERPTLNEQGRVLVQRQRPPLQGQRTSFERGQQPQGPPPRPGSAPPGGITPRTTTAGQGPVRQPTHPSAPLQLTYTHFEEVAMVIEKFEDYLYETMGGSSADIAGIAGTRADGHISRNFDNRRYSPQTPSTHQQRQAEEVFQRRKRYVPPPPGNDPGPGPSARGPPAGQHPMRARFSGAPRRGGGGPPRPQAHQQNPRGGGLPAQRGRGGTRPGGGRRDTPEWQEGDVLEERHHGWDVEPQGEVSPGAEESYTYRAGGGAAGGEPAAEGTYEYDQHGEETEEWRGGNNDDIYEEGDFGDAERYDGGYDEGMVY